MNRAFRYIFGDVVYRGDQRRRGGAGPGEGADNEGTPFWSECKNGKRVSIYAALKQAEDKSKEAGDKRPIVCITKVDHKPILATQKVEDWLAMVYELELLRKAVVGLGLPKQQQPNWLDIIKGKVK